MTTERERLERERARIEERLARLDALPLEPVTDDVSVIVFDRKINGRPYTYAAVRAGGVWWLTGKDRTTSYYRWEELMDILSRWSIEEIWFATEWEEL